jgi:AraC family transcriptional regulator
MGFQTYRAEPDLRHAAGCCSLQKAYVECDTSQPGLHPERAWRRLAVADEGPPIEADILVSRWVDSRSSYRCEKAVSAPDRHVIGVAVKATRLKLARGPHTVFNGIMPAGTMHITGPSQLLTAEFHAPCDFIHFHVSNDCLRKNQNAAHGDPSRPPDLNDLVIRDPLAESLCRTLIERSGADDRRYAHSVGQTLVMHIARMERPQSRINALPKWRLKRVQEYVSAHLDEPLCLADMAAVAGLSRMHFAAQFRAATGYRPHEYLLHQRVESAKEILSNTAMPLAQVAVALGFQAQAHFSTVFRRLTGETPGRWRSNVLAEKHARFLAPSNGSRRDTSQQHGERPLMHNAIGKLEDAEWWGTR